MKTLIIAFLSLSLVAFADPDPRIETAIATMRNHANQSRNIEDMYARAGFANAALIFKTRAESFDEAAAYLTILFAEDLTNDTTLNESIYRTGRRNVGDTQGGLRGGASIARAESGVFAQRAKPDALESAGRQDDPRANPRRN